MRRASVESGRKRIMWNNDNARLDGRTSIRVLLDWLTTPENYDRWCESKTRSGGETREQLCSEIREEMEEEGLFHRENANIRTQINELERSYASAVAWLGANGFDVGDSNLNTSEVGRHVLKMCRYFHDLHYVMSGRQALLGPSSAVSSSRTVHKNADAQHTLEKDRKNPIQASRAADVERESAQTRLAPLHRPRQQCSPEQSGEGRSAYAPPSGSRSRQGIHTAPEVPYLLNGRVGGRSVPRRAELAPRYSTHGGSQSSEEDESQGRKRLRMEETRHRLECKKLRYEVETARLRLGTERVLSRRALEDAGVRAEEVEAVLSVCNGEASE